MMEINAAHAGGRTWLVLCAALICWMSVQEAQAYVVNGRGWKTGSVQLSVDPSLEALDPDALAAVTEAAARWHQAGAPSLEVLSSSTPLKRSFSDNLNVVAVYREDWPFDPGLMAATITARNRWTRRLNAADVYINAADHAWGGGKLDLRSCLLHELGHLMDLGHERTDTRAVMYRELDHAEVKRALTPDDEAGIRKIYQGSAMPFLPGCQAAGAVPGVSALLVVLWTSRVFRRRERVPVAVTRRRWAGVLALVGLVLAWPHAHAGAEALPADAPGVLRGHVISAVLEDVGGPLPSTLLTLTETTCLKGRCPTREVRVPGGILPDGTEVSFQGLDVPTVGDRVVLPLDPTGTRLLPSWPVVGFLSNGSGTDQHPSWGQRAPPVRSAQ